MNIKLIFRVLLVLGIIYNGSKYYVIYYNLKVNNPVSKKVLKKYCRTNKGNKIIINHKGKVYTIEVSDKQCKSLAEGINIDLYYISGFDSFYIPFRKDELFLFIAFSLIFLATFLKSISFKFFN